MRSERHDEPGYDLTALFTLMHSSVDYLKLKRFCLTCTSGQQLDLNLSVLKWRSTSFYVFAHHYEVMLTAQCNGYRIMTSSAYSLIPYKPLLGLIYSTKVVR